MMCLINYMPNPGQFFFAIAEINAGNALRFLEALLQ
jgi:hypothetical protein